MPLFLRGLVIGFAIAAPVGAIGVLCIRRTLAHGRMHGLASGLGAATADALYGSVAAFGLTAVSAVLVSARLPLRVAGGAFLVYLGVRTFFTEPPSAEVCGERPPGGGLGAYGSAFALTLTNPTTILSFAAVFAGLGLAAAPGYAGAALLVAGVFSGSAAWWLLLSTAVGALRERFDARAMRLVDRVSGALIACFGLAALASAVVVRA